MLEEKKPMRQKNETALSERMSQAPTFIPQVDIVETEDALVLLADLPGVNKDDLDVILENGDLTIEGRVQEMHEPDMSLYRKEYDTGDFHRRFHLGEGLDAKGVDASLHDGVLRLTIPKTEQYKARRIEIKGE